MTTSKKCEHVNIPAMSIGYNIAKGEKKCDACGRLECIRKDFCYRDITSAEANEAIDKARLETIEKMKEDFKRAIYGLDMIKIVGDAIQNRETSWSEKCFVCGHPHEPAIVEWRNATDEIRWAILRELERKKILKSLMDVVRDAKLKSLKGGV